MVSEMFLCIVVKYQIQAILYSKNFVQYRFCLQFFYGSSMCILIKFISAAVILLLSFFLSLSSIHSHMLIKRGIINFYSYVLCQIQEHIYPCDIWLYLTVVNAIYTDQKLLISRNFCVIWMTYTYTHRMKTQETLCFFAQTTYQIERNLVLLSTVETLMNWSLRTVTPILLNPGRLCFLVCDAMANGSVWRNPLPPYSMLKWK